MITSDDSKLIHDKFTKTYFAVSYMRVASDLLMKVFSEECINLKMQYDFDEGMSVIVELAMILSEHNITELFNSDGTASELLEDYFILKAPILLRLPGNMDLYEDEQTNDVNHDDLRENGHEG